MRKIGSHTVTAAVRELLVDANISLSESVRDVLAAAEKSEESLQGREVLGDLLRNAAIAEEQQLPICQDTGLAVVFVEVGQDAHIIGGDLYEAISEGVRQAYREGYLRKSCCHPFTRKNTGDNLPPIIHTKLVPGEAVKITVMPKGGGSENCSEVRMLVPSQGKEGVKAFILDMVTRGGPNPCPPIIIGVGVGGNFETSALLSKEALMRPLGVRNNDPEIGALEMEVLEAVNRTGIGPQGYGGTVTALDVHIELLPCHIASLPVAVNIQCHAHRVRSVVL